MDNTRRKEFYIGVMVLMAIAASIVLALLFGPKDGFLNFQKRYNLQVRFDSAPDVMQDTPVLKSGILIGRVSNVELIEKDRGVMVTVEIDEDRHVYSDEVCRINRNLIGDSTLEFVRLGPPEFDAVAIEPGSPPLEGIVPSDPLQAVGNLESSLTEALDSVADTSYKLGTFVDNMNAIVGSDENMQQAGERFNELITKTYETMDAIDQLADGLNTIVGDEQTQAQLRSVVQQMPEVIGESRTLVRRLNTSLDLVEANLENLEKITGGIAENGQPMMANLADTLKQLNILSANLAEFSQQFGKNDGTLNRLMKDPELYDRTVRVLRNVEELTMQLEPVLSDVRVMSDKLANDPSQLGLRGLLQRDRSFKSSPTLFAPTRNWSSQPPRYYYVDPTIGSPSAASPPVIPPTIVSTPITPPARTPSAAVSPSTRSLIAPTPLDQRGRSIANGSPSPIDAPAPMRPTTSVTTVPEWSPIAPSHR